MLDKIDENRREATKRLDQSKRSQLGQFLTPSTVAVFIASLFEENSKSKLEILDAGAGVGSLTAAFLERSQSGWGAANNINITAFEIDNGLLRYFEENLLAYRSSLAKNGITLTTKTFHRDFIVDAVDMIKNGIKPLFTHVILNPPYKKINSKSEHRKLLSSIGLETVNLYTAFVMLSILLLKEHGEMVAIIPRSFCNGNYYKSFRLFLTQNVAIRRMHLFHSRNQAFKEDDVLQENIIIHLVKHGLQGDVKISHSTDESLSDLVEQSYLYEQIVKKGDKEAFIHVPGEIENILEDSKLAVYTLEDLKINVSTGPVVDFRVKEYLSMDPELGSIPLLYANHFSGKDLEWPKTSKKPNAIALNEITERMLYPIGFYTVVKRFSSKEEKQRVVARVINPTKIHADLIGIENHLNVFHFKRGGIDEALAYGLAAYLNSSYVDIHFRTFSGHTQVNATDLKQMRYPSLEALKKVGAWAKDLETLDVSSVDRKIKDII